MRKQFFAILLAALMLGSSDALAAAFDANKVKARVESIYKEVFASLDTGIDEGVDFEKKFMSEAYNKDFRAVRGDDYMEWDHWVQGNDFEGPTYRVAKVTQAGDKARVRVIITNSFGTSTPVDLIMVYERGNWFIDDMLTGFDENAAESGYVSEREQMREQAKEADAVVSE